jgi:hypothetical protein
MRRSIVTYAGLLGATYAGILSLSQSFSSQALAAGEESLCYSTGPLENEPSQSEVVFIKVLNNSDKTVKVEVVVFDLNGLKEVNFADETQIDAKSSAFATVDVADKAQFEIQVELKGAEPNTVLLGAFGKKTENNNLTLVAAHRVVHSEWTKIPCAKNNIM